MRENARRSEYDSESINGQTLIKEFMNEKIYNNRESIYDGFSGREVSVGFKIDRFNTPSDMNRDREKEREMKANIYIYDLQSTDTQEN